MVADDAGVGEQRDGPALAVTGDFFDVEAVEGAAIVFAFRQHDGPAQSGLRALERQQLEQRAIVMQRHAPLKVVVDDIERLYWPRTTRGAHAGGVGGFFARGSVRASVSVRIPMRALPGSRRESNGAALRRRGEPSEHPNLTPHRSCATPHRCGAAGVRACGRSGRKISPPRADAPAKLRRNAPVGLHTNPWAWWQWRWRSGRHR